jgi:hypothetical protein
MSCTTPGHAKHGWGRINKNTYNKLYAEVVDLMQGVANKVGKENLDTLRLPKLILRGQMVLVQKQILCFKKKTRHTNRHTTRERTERYGMEINKEMDKSLKDMRQKVTRRQNKFGECKKSTETERTE